MTEPEVPDMVEIEREEIMRLRAIEARLPELEQAISAAASDLDESRNETQAMTAERNNALMAVSDITQERDRLRQLLLDSVQELEGFSPDYPNAQTARFAFTGTSTQVQQKMAAWDSVRNDKNSTYEALVNYVRQQATV